MITRTFTIEESLYEDFQVSCIRGKITVSEKIRNLIEIDLERIKSEQKKENNKSSF